MPADLRYMVVPDAGEYTKYPDEDTAIEVAKSRIDKNQRCYGGHRARRVYAVCRIIYLVKPVRPQVDVEIIPMESPNDA
jgi:hypothetical protein